MIGMGWEQEGRPVHVIDTVRQSGQWRRSRRRRDRRYGTGSRMVHFREDRDEVHQYHGR